MPQGKGFFLYDILLRDEVASCIEVAYEELSVEEATKALFFNKVEQMRAFAKQRQWVEVNGKYTFAKTKQAENALPAEDLTKILLHYTHELEQII